MDAARQSCEHFLFHGVGMETNIFRPGGLTIWKPYEMDGAMNEWLSIKFKWMSIVATFAVVGLHSNIGRVDTQLVQMAYKTFAFAVPTFFLISGYLFVGSARKYSYVELLKKKFFSLYVPAVLAALLVMAIDTPMRIYAHEPYSWLEFLRLFGLVFSFGCLHLWYVRALIIFFIFTPIILFAIRKWPVAALLMALAAFVPYDAYWYSLNVPRSVFFFLFGSLLATYTGAVVMERLSKFWWLEILMGIGLITAYALQLIQGPVVRIALPLGEVSLLSGLYDFVSSCVKVSAPNGHWDVMFFIYLFHTIILSYLGGGLRILRQRIDIPSDLMFALAFATFFANVVLANILRNHLPRLYGVLTGGRIGPKEGR